MARLMSKRAVASLTAGRTLIVGSASAFAPARAGGRHERTVQTGRVAPNTGKAALTGEVLPPDRRTLTELATIIRTAEKEVVEGFTKALTHCIEIGRALIEAKAQCRHGDWGRFIDEQCQMTMTRSQRYMRLAKSSERLEKNKSVAVTPLSQRKALRLLTAPKRRRRRRKGETAKPQSWEV